ncbi:hypothetical protein Tco_0724145 [Tanacetum coccineum]
MNKDQYAVSRENQYDVFKIWNQYNILEDIKRGPYSKKSPTCLGDLDNSTSNVLIPLDSWTSGLLVYKLPLSDRGTRSVTLFVVLKRDSLKALVDLSVTVSLLWIVDSESDRLIVVRFVSMFVTIEHERLNVD